MTEEEYKKLGDKRYDRDAKQVPTTSTTPNFVTTESTRPAECGDRWGELDQGWGESDQGWGESDSGAPDDGDEHSADCWGPTEPTTERDYGGYQDYGFEGYPDYEGNQVGIRC